MIDPSQRAGRLAVSRPFLLFLSLLPVVISFAVLRLACSRSESLGSIGVFASFWGSGWASAHGLDPYGLTPFTPVYGSAEIHVPDLNLNPPILLPLFRALSNLDIGLAVQISTVVSTLGFVFCAGYIFLTEEARSYVKVAWLFIVPYFYQTIYLGQIYVLFFVLSTIACLSLSSRRWTRAGWAIGACVACRPTFALWIAMLWLAGHRRASHTAAAVATGLTLVSLVVCGPTTFGRWLSALAADRHAVFGTNASLAGYLTRLGHPSLGIGASVLIVACACVWSWRVRGDASETSLAALATSMLAAPLSWVHYALLLMPALLLRPWGVLLAAAALLLCLPVQIPLTESLDRSWWGALACAAYPAAFALVAADVFLRSRARTRDARPVAEAGIPPGVARSAPVAAPLEAV